MRGYTVFGPVRVVLVNAHLVVEPQPDRPRTFGHCPLHVPRVLAVTHGEHVSKVRLAISRMDTKMWMLRPADEAMPVREEELLVQVVHVAIPDLHVCPWLCSAPGDIEALVRMAFPMDQPLDRVEANCTIQ